MSLFSQFREKLKFKTEDKDIRRYSTSDIHIREDNETGNLELYIVKKFSEKSSKAWTVHRFNMRDINIRNHKNKIDYVLEISPSGLHCRREYIDPNDAERFGKMYSVPSILQQVLGISLSEAYDMHFTIEELLKLIEKINKQKDKAIYTHLYLVEYLGDDNRERLLEGLHITETYDNDWEKRN